MCTGADFETMGGVGMSYVDQIDGVLMYKFRGEPRPGMWFMLPVQYGVKVGSSMWREWWLIPRKVTRVSEGEMRRVRGLNGWVLSPSKISFGVSGNSATIICEDIIQVSEEIVETVMAHMIAMYTGKVSDKRLIDPMQGY
jgi:hypothetical protein